MNFRDRLRASGWHFIATLCVGLPAAGLVFCVWYPSGLSRMLGGFELFGLVVGCDLILGPIISLVIFDRSKPKPELVRDYVVIALVQALALAYGLSVVWAARPAFLAFTKDRFEIVTAIDLEDSDLANASRHDFRMLPMFGPRTIGVQLPSNPEERKDALFAAVGGKDVYLQPKFYVDFVDVNADALRRAQPIELLEKAHPGYSEELHRAIKKLGGNANQYRWLPVHHRFGFGTALIDATTAEPLVFLPIDPY